MRLTALAGGVGGARFLRGLLAHLAEVPPDDGGPHRLTVIVNTADDITLHGLRVCPDLDTVLYTLGGGVHEEQGWGRTDERSTVAEELAAYGEGPDWFTLGDRDIATHLIRTRMLAEGATASQVAARLTRRWDPSTPTTVVEVLPMSDDPVETHVDVTLDGDRTTVHFQQWWVRHHADLPTHGFEVRGVGRSRPAPGVLRALATSDLVLLPPSNPVVSIGTILAVPGVRDAVRDASAPVVGVSPVISGAPVRGMADRCLAAVGVETSASGVAGLYADLLDGWLVDDSDAALATDGPPVVRARPLLMTDVPATAAIAGAAVDLGRALRGRSS